MTLKVTDDGMCYVCGKKNLAGLRLDFSHPQPGRLVSEVTFEKIHQGYKNIVHGGLVAAVLDEMMVNLAWLEGFPAMTAQLTVRLKKAVPVGQKVLLEGLWDRRGGGRILTMSATAKSPKGDLYATAWAKCLPVKKG
jgi:acyl-coenzyme A thioesterase PaaI-like protein